ncbi:MAG: hypothetical protein NVS3B1_22060 [Marmoricola sp.]
MPSEQDLDLFDVDLPAGGMMHLRDKEEVDLWTVLSERYRRDYRLSKVNDLTMLGNLLLQHLTMFRAQREMSGVKWVSEDGRTKLKSVEISDTRMGNLQESVQRASREIREIEKAMGIDAKTRQQAGSQTIPDYLARLKRFGREMGIHISHRTHAYEEFVNELSWRVRLEQNGDTEDKAYHECTPEGILKWTREQLEVLEEVDRKFALEKNKLVLGKI